jgi:hypothetical protein
MEQMDGIERLLELTALDLIEHGLLKQSVSELQRYNMRVGRSGDLLSAAERAPSNVGALVEGLFVPTIYGLTLVPQGRRALRLFVPALRLGVEAYVSGQRRLTMRSLRRKLRLDSRSALCLATILDLEGGIFLPEDQRKRFSANLPRAWSITEEARHCEGVERIEDYLTARRTAFGASEGDSGATAVGRRRRRPWWSRPRDASSDMLWRALIASSRFIRDATVQVVALVVVALFTALAVKPSVPGLLSTSPPRVEAAGCGIDAVMEQRVTVSYGQNRVLLELWRSLRCAGAWAQVSGQLGLAQGSISVVEEATGKRYSQWLDGHVRTELLPTNGCAYALFRGRYRGRPIDVRTDCH